VDARRSSPIRSESSMESLGLVSPDSEDLGYLLGDEAVEERGEEVIQQTPKRARTDAGPSAAAGSSWSGRKDWMYWLGARSDAGEGQTPSALGSAQAPVSMGGHVPTPTL
jgi:hypothetical protein